MRLKSIFNISFIVMIFVYQLIGKGGECIHTAETIRWGRVFFMFVYGHMAYNNFIDYGNCIINLHRDVMLSTLFYFLASLLTEIICFIWTDLYYVFMAKTHFILSGTALLLLTFIYLTYKSYKK